MGKKRVVIDVGHGKDTYPPSKGVPQMPEFEFNNAVGKLAKRKLEEQGIEVLLSQPFDSNEVSLRRRVDYINGEHRKKKVECVVSIHADASNNPSAQGHWVFHWHNSSQSNRLAGIWDRHARELPNRHRGIMESKVGMWTNFMILRSTVTPAILIEHGFMTNKDDLKLLLSDAFREQSAVVLTKAVCEFCGVNYKEPTTKPRELYRVRKAWNDIGSQKSANHDLDKAIAVARSFNLNVYNSRGKKVYPTKNEHWAQRYYDNLKDKGYNIENKGFDKKITYGDMFKILDTLTDDTNGEEDKEAKIELKYNRLLKQGVRGNDVKQLQARLNQLGFNAGAADGIYGNGTRRAVVNFQSNYGLATDGMAGRNTINMLNNPQKPKVTNLKTKGSTQYVEVDPMDLKISVQDRPGNRINLSNYVTGGFQWHHANGVTYPLGILASENRGISNRQPHNKPAGTLLVHRDGNVDVKDIPNLGNESMVRFAVSGCSILPVVRMTSAGFTGVYSDIGRYTNRPMIGYRPSDNKIIIAVAKCNITQAKNIMSGLGCSKAITLDAGGSTVFKVNNRQIVSTTRRLHSVITW